MIGWHLRRTLQAQQLIEAGRRPEAAVGNMPRGPRQKFIAMLQRRPLGKVQQDFRRLIRADLSMKTGAGPAGAMQELVIKLCT
jgi:DNA polymerase III delta subunit